MGKIIQAVPVLPSMDIAGSVQFFVEKLGFSDPFQHGDPAQYGGVARDGVQVHFITVKKKLVCEWTVCRIYVEEIDQLYTEAQAAGIVHPNGPLTKQDWGERDFSVLDHCGVLITFAETL